MLRFTLYYSLKAGITHYDVCENHTLPPVVRLILMYVCINVFTYVFIYFLCFVIYIHMCIYVYIVIYICV